MRTRPPPRPTPRRPRWVGAAAAIALMAMVLLASSLSHPAGSHPSVLGPNSPTVPSSNAVSSGVNYTVSFHATGLPNQTLWFVTMAGVQNFALTPKSITFQVPSGNYTFAVAPVPGYAANPATGKVQVVNSTSSHPISFGPPPPSGYVVTFTESGLSVGTVWSATLNGATVYSSGGSIVFLEPNGSFEYGIGLVSDYTVSPQTGLVTVNGSAPTISIEFKSDKGILGLPGVAGDLLVGALVLEVLGALVLIGLWFRSRRPRRAAPAEVRLPPPPAT